MLPKRKTTKQPVVERGRIILRNKRKRFGNAVVNKAMAFARQMIILNGDINKLYSWLKKIRKRGRMTQKEFYLIKTKLQQIDNQTNQLFPQSIEEERVLGKRVVSIYRHDIKNAAETFYTSVHNYTAEQNDTRLIDALKEIRLNRKQGETK